MYNTTIGQRTFSFRGATIWNSLDKDLKQLPSLTRFKNKFKKRYVKQTLYLIIEHFKRYFYTLHVILTIIFLPCNKLILVLTSTIPCKFVSKSL